jgi:hypothetical protein
MYSLGASFGFASIFLGFLGASELSGFFMRGLQDGFSVLGLPAGAARLHTGLFYMPRSTLDRPYFFRECSFISA